LPSPPPGPSWWRGLVSMGMKMGVTGSRENPAGEVGGKESIPCLPELCILFPKKNNRGISNSWPPSILSQTQRQRPIMQNRFYRKAEGGGRGEGDNSCEVFFLLKKKKKSHQGSHYNFIISRKTK